VTKQEVFDADEIWISSSSKEIAPVTQIDDQIIGDGMPGPIWEKAAKLYSAGKFNY
jgi:D-alanine transaminase